jgi:hypothetical protein
MADWLEERKGKRYSFKVQGVLDKKWADWFDGFAITSTEQNETVLVGRVVDQSALHGMLAKIHDLGLILLLVERLEEPEI